MGKLKSIAMMTPALLEKFKLFQDKMEEAKLPFMITSVARTVKEQVALYSQGRDPLSTVNKLRKIAGLPSIKTAENIKVTWTLVSKHLVDFDDGIEENNWSRAFDIAILIGKEPTWNLKIDVNKDQIKDYEQAGLIGESVGLKWGGRFKNKKGEPTPDYPHFEI